MSENAMNQTEAMREIETKRYDIMEPLFLKWEELSAALRSARANQEIRKGLQHMTLQFQNSLREYHRWYRTRDPYTLRSLGAFHSDIVSNEVVLQEFRTRLTCAGRGLDEYARNLEDYLDELLTTMTNIDNAEDLSIFGTPDFSKFPDIQEYKISDLATEWNTAQLQQLLDSAVDEVKLYHGY